MQPKFEVVFLKEAIEFMSTIDSKAQKKIYFNLDKAKFTNDPRLFKKLSKGIWEFRTLYQGKQYRLFAFWDKSDNKETLVLATHGMIKKVSKVPQWEIDKALRIKDAYFYE
jgi:phage-related protein